MGLGKLTVGRSGTAVAVRIRLVRGTVHMDPTGTLNTRRHRQSRNRTNGRTTTTNLSRRYPPLPSKPLPPEWAPVPGWSISLSAYTA